MSTYDGTESKGLEERDPAFQVAPAEGDGPNMTALLNAFKRTMADNQPFLDQCRLNYETRYAIWNGQSADGKKHARESNGKNEPTPWDGASDLRVFMTDTVINYKVARNCTALSKASIVAQPVNGNDIERANVVGNFMRWVINTQIPDMDREMELLSNYLLEKGVALTGQFWQEKQEKTLITLRLTDFLKMFPGVTIQHLRTALNHPDFEDKILATFVSAYDVSKAKAKKMLSQMRKTEETTVPVTGKTVSRPIIRAFCLDKDVFVPSWATDIETAPYIFRVEYFTAEQLRGYANTEDWDKKWVDAAIEKCRGVMITSIPDSTLQPISRSFVYIDRKIQYTDLIGVVFSYQRLSDTDGVPGIYLTIFNPHLTPDETQEGYAKFGLLGYQHGEYPFVLHRREFLSRKFHDSRGLPEPGKSWQDQTKAHRDSRIDAASVAILPPVCYPLGRPPTRWGPGARIPERRPGEYHYADRPTGDVNTENSEAMLVKTFNEYAGVQVEGDDPTVATTQNQWEVVKYLRSWSKSLRQVWKLWQQYGDDQTFFRIIGIQKAPQQVMTKGSPSEDFDFWLTYDSLMLSPEQMIAKIEAMVKFAQSVDKMGQVDYSKFLEKGLDMIDASIAEAVILPADTSQKQTIAQVQGDLAEIYAGIPHDMKPGTPPQLAMQVIQQYMQQPDIQQRYQSDQGFKARMDQYSKQATMQIKQQQNAVIGRIGAAPAGTPQAAIAPVGQQTAA